MLNALKARLSSKSAENRLSIIAILYFISGIIFAIFFAWYYHWEFVGYFSPGFYAVVFSWPYQAIGLARDISAFGLSYPTIQ